MIVNVIVTQRHRRPSTQTSRKPVVLVCCSWFWVVLVGIVGGSGWFLAGFVGGFGWFRVLVTMLAELNSHWYSVLEI